MATILGPPPQAVRDDLGRLNTLLKVVPPKTAGDNLLIGTWNIRSFGSLTEKWESEDGDSPRRDFHAAVLIVAVLERFDVIAPGLEKVPRTLCSSVEKPDLASFFDQIAWFERRKDGKPYLSSAFRQAAGPNFQGVVLQNLPRIQLSWRISDHYPLWVEFGLN
ncbi:MAG: hypothetical protein KYX67_15865 [Brevundimonas sp.]|uniref:hypothetical protein n=1 Tax=Brevundimonas sp. TaxID=1871086 RepID=UPI0025616ECB|nr:hypothetical protein [Brevundimonas sp.]MDK2748795.1 hypothetical protein [Brevundimonas sp.]